MLSTPFYDPKKSFKENFTKGPFGAFSDGEIIENIGEPKYSLFGLKLYSPFGIAAGPLGNSNFMKAALDKGFDIVTQKTVRTREKPVHPWPNILPIDVAGDFKINSTPSRVKDSFAEPLTITNSFGNASLDPSFWQPDIAKAVKYAKKGQIVCASFEGTRWPGYSEEDYVNDWVLAAKLLKETGVGFLEANLSCPNEGSTSLLCHDAAKVETIVRAVKKEIGTLPLVLKISYFSEETELYDLVKRTGSLVDGFSAINTISAEVVDKNGKQALPGEGRLMSGVGGHAIKWAGLDMVKKLKKLREEFNQSFIIIGVGGVMNAEDFFEYRNAGADIVMSVTGAMWNPYLGRDIALEIKKKLR